MTEDVAKLVVGDLADIACLAAHAREGGDGIGGGAAGNFHAGAHFGVKRLGLIGFDKGHGALVDLVFGQEVVDRLGQDVHNRVSDTDKV